MRDVSLGSTLDFKLFATRVDTGAPADVASIAVSAYPDNSTTQITAGITTTQPFDSLTGFGNVRVVATAANGYAVGSTYTLVITTGTVNSVSVVGAIIGEFSIRVGVPGLIASGTAQSATATTIVLAAATAFADDILNGATVAIVSGTGAGQSRTITDWVSVTDTATVDTWVTDPDSTSIYEVYFTPPASSTSPIPVNVTQAAGTAWNSGAINDATLAADTITAAKVADGTIDAATFAANAITSTVLANDAITAAKIATGAVDADAIAANAITDTKIATGAITAAKFAAGAIDAAAIAANAIGSSELADGAITAAKFAANAITSTVVADDTITAAKIATAALPSSKFDEADPPPANVVEVNDVAVAGDGEPGTEWGPA